MTCSQSQHIRRRALHHVQRSSYRVDFSICDIPVVNDTIATYSNLSCHVFFEAALSRPLGYEVPKDEPMAAHMGVDEYLAP